MVLHPQRMQKNSMPRESKQVQNKWIVIRITRDVQQELIRISQSKIQTYDSILRGVLKMDLNIVSRKDISHDQPGTTQTTSNE
jgi:hypothetical protein